jgi:PhnB protein
MANLPDGYTRVTPYLLYEDAAAAIEHLTRVLGFTVRHTATGAAGRMHAELVLGDDDALVMLGQAGVTYESPARAGYQPPVMIHVYVDDAQELHERAAAQEANVSELDGSPQGDRRFTATDPEGQVWVFAQRLA